MYMSYVLYTYIYIFAYFAFLVVIFAMAAASSLSPSHSPLPPATPSHFALGNSCQPGYVCESQLGVGL